MVALGALSSVLLASCANAQLLLHPYIHSILTSKASSSNPINTIQYGAENQHQQPLVHSSLYSDGASSSSKKSPNLPSYKAGQHTIIEQDNSTCPTNGERQWTGTVDVTDEHRLFYWFFDSRNDPENDPIIFWINGGPGGSSMMGLFAEMGPCVLELNADEPVPNPWSWNNNASVLFIDQPAGVGLSSRKEGSPTPKLDFEGAVDFQVFLNIFFGDIFPDRARLPIHFAAESYGGHYGPTYVDHILKSRAYDSKHAFWGNITSLILVDAVIDFVAPKIGVYELLCSDFRGGNIISTEDCDSIRLALPECEKLGRSCEASYDGYECLAMIRYCEEHIDGPYFKEVEKGKRNPYNIHLDCGPEPSSYCEDPSKGNYTAYLNQPSIKKALGFPESFEYSPIDWELNDAFTSHANPWKPCTREVAAILDAHTIPDLGDIKLLVINGNEDYIVNTPGNLWAYDNLRWSGQPEYRITRLEDLDEEEMKATGFWKGTRDGRLVFVGVDGAGHEVPGDVREGSYRILSKFIDGGFVQN